MGGYYPLPTPDEAPPDSIEAYARKRQQQLADIMAAAQPTGAAYRGSIPVNKEQEQLDTLTSRDSPSTPAPLTPEHRAALQEMSAPAPKANSGPSPDMQAMLDKQAAASTPSPSNIRVSTHGEPMHDYAPSGGTPEFAGDRVFGHERTTPTLGGGVSMTGGSDDKAAYERYRRNLEGDAAVDADLAQHSLSQRLTADPFAREHAQAESDIHRATGIAQGQSDVATAAQQKETDSINQMIDMGAKQQIAQAHSDPRWAALAPEQRQAMEQRILQRAESMKYQTAMELRLKKFPGAMTGDLLGGM